MASARGHQASPSEAEVSGSPATLARDENLAEARQAAAAEIRDWERRRRRGIEMLAGFAAPPLVGLGILALVFAGIGSDAILNSAAATCTALIVGSLLLLVPPVLFALSPERYAEHQGDVERRIRHGLGTDPD